MAYDTLMEQLPDYFKPVLEYIALMEVFGAELDDLDDLSLNLYNNTFAQTCDLDTIAYWETLLGLSVRYGDSEEYRRERLIQKFNMVLPYTIVHLKEQLIDLFDTNYVLTLDPVACELSATVTSGRDGAIRLLWELLLDRVPAHIKITTNQQVTNYINNNIYVGGVVRGTPITTISAGE